MSAHSAQLGVGGGPTGERPEQRSGSAVDPRLGRRIQSDLPARIRLLDERADGRPLLDRPLGPTGAAGDCGVDHGSE